MKRRNCAENNLCSIVAFPSCFATLPFAIAASPSSTWGFFWLFTRPSSHLRTTKQLRQSSHAAHTNSNNPSSFEAGNKYEPKSLKTTWWNTEIRRTSPSHRFSKGSNTVEAKIMQKHVLVILVVVAEGQVWHVRNTLPRGPSSTVHSYSSTPTIKGHAKVQLT